MTNRFNPFLRHQAATESQPGHETAKQDPAAGQPVKPATHDAGNPFDHHKVEPKAQPEPERTREPLPPQILLTWLRDNWSKPVISLRDLQVFGPRGIRDRKSALAHAETLERYGWLVPMKAHRRDRRLWMLPPARATVAGL
jgi:hypothetical protein